MIILPYIKSRNLKARVDISDEEIETAFAGTNFGGRNRKKLLQQGVLKRLTGYSCGHTLTVIMHELGLTTKKNNVTKKGKIFCMDAFYDNECSG